MRFTVNLSQKHNKIAKQTMENIKYKTIKDSEVLRGGGNKTQVLIWNSILCEEGSNSSRGNFPLCCLFWCFLTLLSWKIQSSNPCIIKQPKSKQTLEDAHYRCVQRGGGARCQGSAGINLWEWSIIGNYQRIKDVLVGLERKNSAKWCYAKLQDECQRQPIIRC